MTALLVEFGRLLQSLYGTARETPVVSFQDAALELLKGPVGFQHAWWGSATVTSAGMSVHVMHLHNEPEDIFIDYEPVKHEDKTAFAFSAQGGGILNIDSSRWYQGKETSGIKDFNKRHGNAHGLIAGEMNRNGVCHWTSLFRVDEERPYTRREQLLMGSLLPHVMEALTVNRLAHLEHLPGAGSTGRRFHLAIADKKGFLYHAEHGFSDLVSNETRTRCRGRLPDAFMGSLMRRGRFIGRSIVVLVSSDADLLFLKARPREAVDGLSAREHSIARLAVRGLQYKDISRRLGIAPATVRNHLQRIHSKLHARNIAELVRHFE
jgi:DNA-binding CsgD family transcriptional regulator